MDKIALLSCSGLSPLGLVVRTATVELALENENIVAGCISEYSAQPNSCSAIIDDASIVTVNGCEDNCAGVILKEKNVRVLKNISADTIIKENNLNPLNPVRLDGDGEKAVSLLKEYILSEL